MKSILEVKTVRARAKRITKLTEICGVSLVYEGTDANDILVSAFIRA